MACLRHLARLFIGILSGGILGMIIGSILGPLYIPFLFRLFHSPSFDPGIEGAFVGSCVGIVIGGLRTLSALCTIKTPALNTSPSKALVGEEIATPSGDHETRDSKPDCDLKC